MYGLPIYGSNHLDTGHIIYLLILALLALIFSKMYHHAMMNQNKKLLKVLGWISVIFIGLIALLAILAVLAILFVIIFFIGVHFGLIK